MKTKVIALSAAVVMATAPAVFAQGMSSKTPAQEMQQSGTTKAQPGATRHAAGHKMHHAMHHAKASKNATAGASNAAPGQTTGASTKSTTGSSKKSGY